MRVFEVYWKKSIAPEGEDYKATAVVIAEDFAEASTIAGSYGEVSMVSDKGEAITTEKGSLPGWAPVPNLIHTP